MADIALSQLKQAMEVNAANTDVSAAALEAVVKMKASLVERSYAVLAVDDARLRATLYCTADFAERWFIQTTTAEKRSIQQDSATAGTVDSTSHRLPKHGHTSVRSHDNSINKEVLNVCWKGGRFDGHATVTTLPPKLKQEDAAIATPPPNEDITVETEENAGPQVALTAPPSNEDVLHSFLRETASAFDYGFKALEDIAQQALRAAALVAGLEAQDLALLPTLADLEKGTFAFSAASLCNANCHPLLKHNRPSRASRYVAE